MAWTTFDADTGSTGTNPVDNATWNGGFNSTGASTSVITAPNSIVLRDSNGLSQVGTPVASQDIANKTYVDTVGTTSTPVGSVALFAGNAVPSGWFLCNGQALNRTTYSSLFGVLVPTLGTVTNITIATPTVLTVVAHGLTSGDSIYLTTTGALPTGLTANTQLYYVTVLTVDTFNVSTTYANYVAGTKVAATVAGSGVQTAWRCAFGLGDGTTTFNVPDLRLTAQGIPNATASITAWTTYSLTIGAVTTAPTKGTVTTDLAQWRRIGQQMEWAYDYVQTALGSAGSGTYLFPLPSGYSIDLTRFPANTIVGVANMSTAADEIAASSDQGSVYVYDANNLAVKYVSPTSATEVLTYVGSTLFPLSTAIIRYRFKASVLIAQFTTNNNLLSYNIKS